MGRSIVAIVVGFVVIAALSLGTDLVLKALLPGYFSATGRTDNAAILVLVLLYVGAYATFGCWLAARLAPNRPMRHAIVLGLLGLAFNVMGTIAAWDTAPRWYHLSALVLVMLWAWLGGYIRERQLARRSGAPAFAA